MAFQKAASLEDLWSGEKVGLTIAGRKVLLMNIQGTVYAYVDRCEHAGLPLSEGTLDNDVLTCRAHHWQYEASSGCGLNPAGVRLKPLPLIVQQGEIFVDAGDESETDGNAH